MRNELRVETSTPPLTVPNLTQGMLFRKGHFSPRLNGGWGIGNPINTREPIRAFSTLPQESDRQGVAVRFPVTCPHCSNNHADDPGNQHDRQNYKAHQNEAESD